VSHSAGDLSGPSGADEALWFALCLAPDEGTDVGEPLSLTGMSRPTLYRRLAEHAKAGRVVQVSRGRWRAVTIEEPPR
jgi:predicted DNA-binding transcriptional regulator AlpA